MKISDIKSRIIAKGIITAVLLIILAGLTFYTLQLENSGDQEASKIKREISSSNQKAKEYESQVSETRKYRKIWLTVPENQKSTEGINVDKMNESLKYLASKYNISDQNIKLDVPQKLQNNMFNGKTIEVFHSPATLTFRSIDDVRALQFLAEFLQEMIGYTVVTNVSITKSRDYSDQDLIALSSGKNIHGIDVRIEFIWYFYRAKAINQTAQDTI